MSDTSLHHIPAPGTAAFRDVGTGPNQIVALSDDPGTADGSKFIRDDGTFANPTGERGPAGLPNPEIGLDLGDSGASVEIPSMATATVFVVTLTASDVEFDLPELTTIEEVPSFFLVVQQDATGGRTWVAPGKWAGEAAPGLSTNPGDIDVFAFIGVYGVGWLGFPAGFGFR